MFTRSINRRTFVSGATASALATSLGSRLTFAQDKSTIGVGSKNYTEQLTMGAALGLLLDDAGYPTNVQLNLGGTAIAHEALIHGDIDTYVEYTGTALVAILGEDLPESGDDDVSEDATPEGEIGMDAAYEIVAARYPDEFEVKWLKPWGFNNTYTVSVRQETAEEYGLETFSDLEDIAGDLLLGTDQEFPIREDGLPAFEEAYGYTFKDVVQGEIGIMYSALAEGDVDAIVSYATDGRIAGLNLKVLADDKEFFPPYYSAPIIRMDTLEENPEIEEILNQPAGLIDNDLMASYNLKVDDEGWEPEEAARGLLEEIGILDAE